MESMHRLADDIREAFSDRGHKVDKAVQSDHAFRRTRHPQSTMVRGLVLDAVEDSASRHGLHVIPIIGGGCDVQHLVDVADRRFRVLKAERDRKTGQYDIICKSDAILTITDSEPVSFFVLERWVLAYTVDDVGMIIDIFAAPVLGITGDAVPRLRIGLAIPLGSTLPSEDPTSGFLPAEEDLDLDEEVSNDEDGTGEAM